jgi:RNase P/RNase MRP subunit p29
MGATGFLQKSRRGILGNVLEEEKNLELKLRATEEIRRMQKKTATFNHCILLR